MDGLMNKYMNEWMDMEDWWSDAEG